MGKILLPDDTEVVVASYGGVGTTFLIEFIRKFKKTNCAHDSDGVKHSPLPPLSNNPKIKFVYIYGDPRLAVISLFRRKFHRAQSRKLLMYSKEDRSLLKDNTTLAEYLTWRKDLFRFERHFQNWYDSYLNYPTFFVKIDDLFKVKSELVNFLELPESALKEFPIQKVRNSKIESLDSSLSNLLDEQYAQFSSFLKGLNSYVIRIPEASRSRREILQSRPYKIALRQHYLFYLKKTLSNIKRFFIK
ncbi:MAG: hypothetical protein RIC95_08750 [Vicingaceae bacterium]